MQFCSDHWNQLKDEIVAVGLYNFVYKDGKKAAEKLKEHLEGLSDPTEPYDPLMNAHWMIVSNALHCGGAYLMEGDYCPLCELEFHSPSKAAEWITPCCLSLLNDFKDKGWYKEPLVM